MENKEIYNYIREQLKEGKSTKEIEKNLLEAGYQKKDAQEILTIFFDSMDKNHQQEDGFRKNHKIENALPFSSKNDNKKRAITQEVFSFSNLAPVILPSTFVAISIVELIELNNFFVQMAIDIPLWFLMAFFVAKKRAKNRKLEEKERKQANSKFLLAIIGVHLLTFFILGSVLGYKQIQREEVAHVLSEEQYINMEKGFKIYPPEGWAKDEVVAGEVSFFSPAFSRRMGGPEAIIIIHSEPIGDVEFEDYIDNIRQTLLYSDLAYQITNEENIFTVDGSSAHLMYLSYLMEIRDSAERHEMNAIQLATAYNRRGYTVAGLASEDYWENYQEIIKQSLMTFEIYHP